MERRQIQVDQLIDDIYDSGASPGRWPATLARIASAAGAEGGVMFGFSAARGLVLEYSGAFDATSAAIFKTRHANNVWVQAMARRPVNQLVLADSFLKLRELKRTAFYDEVLRPQHIGHAALTTLTFATDLNIQFSVHKAVRNGCFRPGEELLLKRLVPHVRRAVGVSLRLAGSGAEVPAASLTDRMNCAAFTLCCRGELVGFNDHAKRLVTNGDSFMLSAAGICFAEPQEQRRLVKAVKQVLEGTPLQILTLTHRLHRFEVAVAGLKSRELQWSINAREHASAILVLVTELSRPDTARAFLHIAHALTAAEWRVAKAAAMGVSNGAIASTLNLSANTVKTHLRRVYQKLNVRRQGELVLLMGHYALMDDIARVR